LSQLLALVSAVLFGFGDFTGGYVTRRVSIWRVMLWTQVFGLAILAAGLAVVPWENVTRSDVVWGAAAGLFGITGLGVFYSTLAQGSIAVVAPITGAAGAAIPVIVDLATGGVLDPVQWLGVVLAIGAILLISADRSPGAVENPQVLRALVAGAAFALFFIALSRTAEGSGLWPLAASRVASVPLVAALAVGLRAAQPPGGRDLGLVAAVGSFDMGANVAIALSLQRGSLAVSAVLSSLYPAVTAGLAVVFLEERPKRWQWVGVAAALGAVVALAV
jgi:drug/metabolite transporter (DMT)-like permease